MATKYRHFGSGLFKPGAHDGAGRMVVMAVLLCVGICARGETVTEEPDAFLEYIEATGENGGKQYIDTDVNAETGLKAQIDFAWASGDISGKDWSFLDATIDNSVSDKRTRFLMCHMFKKKPYFGYCKQRGNPSGAVDFVGGERCEIITDMTDPDSLELYQNGVKTFSDEDRTKFGTNGVVNLNLNLFVFACNLSGVPKWYSQGKLYELKIWKNNLESGELDLIRHYLPCKKGHRAGLYDKVHGTISYSYSDENFIAGPELVAVPSYLEGADDQMKAKYNAWAATYGPDTTGEHEAAFLLNVAQTATPVELRIVDVEVVEGGARIRVAAEAGGNGVDLSHANGVIYVAAGDTVTNLVERTVQGTTFSGDGKTATITVPSAA
ncbi:MAG: hypothetical protein J6D25_03520, partial [Eggerthellaceae bacterium]|nr:hypothetical protein [Eggerthellaceae bacterium]